VRRPGQHRRNQRVDLLIRPRARLRQRQSVAATLLDLRIQRVPGQRLVTGVVDPTGDEVGAGALVGGRRVSRPYARLRLADRRRGTLRGLRVFVACDRLEELGDLLLLLPDDLL
jgi:hypothetical protein